MAPVLFFLKKDYYKSTMLLFQRFILKNDLKQIKKNKSDKSMTMRHPGGLGRTSDERVGSAEAGHIIRAVA